MTAPPPKPPRVDDVQRYWTRPPPERSARCAWWAAKIQAGWRRNRRLGGMGYHEAARFFGVYIWEYINVISPLETDCDHDRS